MSALNGQRAIVTGGASGIGASIVSKLRDAGARVVVFDLNEPDGDVSDYVACDIAEPGSVDSSMERATDRLGGLDVLVNCAGVGAQGTVTASTDEDWHRVLNINVVGLARVTRAAWPHLETSPSASVVNISSVAASVGLIERVVYAASKGAVAAMTRAMAADGLASGIRVNAVSPGTVDTPWVQRLLSGADDPEVLLAALESRQPTGRLVSPDQVAQGVLYLADPRNGSSTGFTLEVDGGMTSLVVPT